MEARIIKAGRREYVQVLRLLESFELADLHLAVKTALRIGAVGFHAVKHLVLCQVERRPPKLDLEVYPYLPRECGMTEGPEILLGHYLKSLKLRSSCGSMTNWPASARPRDSTMSASSPGWWSWS